jgi:aspartyl-tRNA(Asn)/glutamyl-tRNA(Gln) amidotransferase subunit B
LSEYKLSSYDSEQLANDTELSSFFFELAKDCNNYKASANWILGPIKNHLAMNESTLEESGIVPKTIASIIALIEDGKISYGIAVQDVLPASIKDPSIDIERFITENQLEVQSSQNEIEKLIEAALGKHAEKIPEYKKGKKGLISLFVGEVMKLSKGKADAKLVTERIIEKLKA